MSSETPPKHSEQSYLSPPRSGRELYRRWVDSWLGDWIDVAQVRALRGFMHVCRFTPDVLKDELQSLLSGSAYHLLSRQRQICFGNLTLATGDVWETDRIRRFTKKIFHYWSKALLDFGRIHLTLNRSNWQRFIQVEGRHHVKWLVNNCNGFIAAGLHMGNWEFMGQSMALMGHPVTSIARRRRHSDELDRELMSWRKKWGQRIIYRDESPRTMLRLLKDGEILGMVTDQYAGRDGIFTNFFGVPTSHYPGPAVLANRAEVPILPAYCYREPDRPAYHVIYDEPIDPVTGGNREENNRAVIKQLFDRFESYIRKHPEQWLWFHRKWRDKWLRDRDLELLKRAPYLPH